MDFLYQFPGFVYLRPILLAGIGIFVTYYLLRNVAVERTTTNRLQQAAGIMPGRPDVAVGSGDFRIRLALEQYRIPIILNEQITRLVFVAGIGAVLHGAVTIIGAPGLLGAVGYVIAYVLVDSIVAGAWSNLVLGIERELPTMMTRVSSTLQVEPNVLLALGEVAETLEEGKPLRPWMLRLISRLQSQGPSAVDELQDEAQAISPSLGLAVELIGKMLKVAGPGYVKAFRIAAENLRETLRVRASGTAKGKGAQSSNQLMIGAVLVVLTMLIRSPRFAVYFQETSSQIIFGLLVGWMFFGWSYINALIRNRLG